MNFIKVGRDIRGFLFPVQERETGEGPRSLATTGLGAGQTPPELEYINPTIMRQAL